MLRLLVVALALTVRPASAQEVALDTLDLVPGDGVLVTDWLRPGTATYDVRLVRPRRQKAGSLTETVTVEGGVVTRVRRTVVPMRGMDETDSLVVDAATLAPRARYSTGGPAEVAVAFAAEGVTGVVTPRSGESRPVRLATGAPVFDAAWIGEVARSVPLEPGAVYRMRAFAPQSPEAPVGALLTVGEPEAQDDGTMAVPVEGDLGVYRATYLVDPETRALRGMRFSPQPGVVVAVVPSGD